MSLPYIYAQPKTRDEWRRWSSNHAANHYDIANTINGNFNTAQTLAAGSAVGAGATIIPFAAVPKTLQQAAVVLGVTDTTTADVIPGGTSMVAYSDTDIALSAAVVSPGIGSGDSIQFAPVTPVNLQQFPLDPMDPNNLGLWLYWHQIMHDQASQILGLSDYDLLVLSWDDPNEFQEWLRLNGDSHVRLCAALGIG